MAIHGHLLAEIEGKSMQRMWNLNSFILKTSLLLQFFSKHHCSLCAGLCSQYVRNVQEGAWHREEDPRGKNEQDKCRRLKTIKRDRVGQKPGLHYYEVNLETFTVRKRISILVIQPIVEERHRERTIYGK